MKMKDSEKRELITALTEVAVKYHDAQQLRARIAGIVLPAISNAEAIIAAKDAEYTTLAQNGGRQLSQLLDQLAAAQAHIEQLQEALKENDDWHKQYDDYNGYPESELCEANTKALAIQTSDEALRRHDAELLRKSAVTFVMHLEGLATDCAMGQIYKTADQLAAELEKQNA